MNDDDIASITVDLPPIKFSGRASVKELEVTVHAVATESTAIYDYLLKLMEESDQKEAEKQSV